MKNHYELLTISKTASYKEIKAAYRKLALQYHPDKNPNNPHAEELFKQIAIAYDTLSSPAKKSRYDAVLSYNQFQYHNPKPTQQPFTPPTTVRSNPTRPSVQQHKSWLNLKNKHFIAALTLSFVLVFGTIGSAIYVQHQQKELLKKKQATEQELYLKLTTQVEQQLANKNYKVSLQLANQLVKDLPKRYDVINYKRITLSNIAENGVVDLQQGRYTQAIDAFVTLISTTLTPNDHVTINYYLGLSYYYNNQAEKAIHCLLTIKADDYPEIPTLLAIIYRDKFNDSAMALSWHTVAKQMLSEQYKHVGFQFVPSDAPQEHFDAYYQSAVTNYKLKKYDAALQDLRGALFLRSANHDALYMKGLCELELGLPDACSSFEKAKKNGHVFLDEMIEENCK